MTMENTSTEPMHAHYGTSIFSANTRLGVKDSLSTECLHLRQGTCKRKGAAYRERDT